MKKKSTDNLREELMQTTDLGRFLHENRDSFVCTGGTAALKELFQHYSISKSQLAKKSGMSEVYLHQLFSGKRSPSRKRALCICLGLGATVEESSRLLQANGYAPLYAKDRWDAVLIYGLSHGMTLQEVNDALFANGLELLLSS